jgi:hypothetical protein
MGTRLVSLKGQSLTWQGQSSLSVSDRGLRRFLRLRNCYVSADGSEIRSFPGFYGLWDNNAIANPDGWAGRYTTDIVRPIYRSNPDDDYQYGFMPASSSDPALQTLRARALPVHYHGFEQVGDVIVLWGESRWREVPIFSADRTKLTVAAVTNTTGTWVLQLSGSPAAPTVSDATGASLNALTADHKYVFLEGLVAASEAHQTLIDAELNGKVHQVASTASNLVTLTSLSSSTALSTVAVGTGQIHIVRPNRDGTYPTAAGTQLTPRGTTLLNQVDDPDALTAWRLLAPLGDGDTRKTCYPAWVANRRRDCGDKIQAGFTEGVTYGGAGQWASRREQQPLPYRTNSECATDRIVLAAPAYGCMFHIPLRVPTNPGAWPDNQGDGSLGIPLDGNSIYDMPRALGIPKARMVVGVDGAPVKPSPSAGTVTAGYNWLAEPIAGPASNGVGVGEWKIAISYEDEATGEEGLASETGTVNITSTEFPYALVVNYIHPGYIMPECLATKVNVYIAPPGQDALAYYASFPLSAIPRVGDTATANNTNFNTSAFYGFQPPSTAGTTNAIMRSIRLPLLGSGDAIADKLDPERLAPQSASMPRGSEACRYLRGVLLAGGNFGNVGATGSLWFARASVRYQPDVSYEREREILIRTYGTDFTAQSATQDGNYGTLHLGMAGRCFPDAYQGVEVISRDLFPNGGFIQRIDRVDNRRTDSLTNAAASNHLQCERLTTTRDFLDRVRDAGDPAATVTTSSGPQNIFYVLPKGQMQVGDPGAPARSSKAAIQFIDPNRGDDITAIGNLAGTAIVCTMRETYSFAWHRNAGGEIPNLISNEHGCIAANSMVEFDGGCAWLGERGPVAMGSGLQFIGLDIQEDFVAGPSRRYLSDSRGMMRHSWACHDAGRGLVMWGLVTSTASQAISFRGSPPLAYSEHSDEAKSRFPCDEVLIWSYRTSSFSTWRPPAGLEVYWMRQIRLADGTAVIAFLAADGRLYALDDTFADSAATPLDYTVTADSDSGTVTVNYAPGTIAVSFPGLDGIAKRWRSGMRVEQFRAGRLIASTLIETVLSVTNTSTTFTTGAPILSLRKGDVLRVGARPAMEIVTNYLGAETMDNLNVSAAQVRYSLFGSQDGHARITALATDYSTHKEITMGPWEPLGIEDNVTPSPVPTDLPRISTRKTFRRGGLDRPECALRIQFTGNGQLRIADLGVEVG